MKKRKRKKGRKAAPGTAQDTATPPENEPSRGMEILRDFIRGLILIGLMVGLNVGIQHTSFGQRAEQWGYDWLQRRLTSDRVPVAVIDINDLEAAPFDIDGQAGIATPRENLRQLITAVAEQDVKAIGLDIDFSPDTGGYITPRDPEFFNFCLELSKKKGIPIFLGIKRTESLSPEKWLGSEDYKSLAVSITIPNRNTRKLPYWIQPNEHAPHGQTMSAALASGFQKSQSKLLRWLHKHELVEQVSEKEIENGVGVGEFMVDYSPLQTLIEDKTLRTISPEVIRDQGRFLRNKIVLLGDGTIGKASDTFTVADVTQPIPGIYLHASAAYTLANAPLYELTWQSRLWIDLLLSLLILISITGIRLYFIRRTTRRVATYRVQVVFTLIILILVFIAGVMFVSTTRLMWSDFLFVLAALLLHLIIEHLLEKPQHDEKRKVARNIADLFLEKQKEVSK